MWELTTDELGFFDGRHDALPLYEALRERILTDVPAAAIRVKKTQISFYDRHLFAAVSFAPVRRAKDRPPVYITLTLGLPGRLDSRRVDAAVEPYPGRWTHHLLIGNAEEIDGELAAWICEAASFAAAKR